MKLLYQGHASLRIITKNNIVIYVDPFAGDGYDLYANIILVTHEHYDHNKVEFVKKDENTIIIRENDLMKNGNYYSKDVFGINIEAVQAYNKNHNKNKCVGYVLRLENKCIYIAGDTSKTLDMVNKLPRYNLDYAFYPCDGIYNMDYVEASECANVVNAKVNIPYHTCPGKLYSGEIANKFKARNVKILLPNNEIEI